MKTLNGKQIVNCQNMVTELGAYNPSYATNLQRKITGFKLSAFIEYKAARFLLLNDFLYEAAIFMHTCLEKEMKAFLMLKGVTNYRKAKHQTTKLFDKMQSLIPSLSSVINTEFLSALSLIYTSRYYDDIENKDYFFLIGKYQYLAELDQSYIYLESLSTVHPELGPDRFTPFEINKYLDVIQQDNHILNSTPKDSLVLADQLIYRYEVTRRWAVVEIKMINKLESPYEFIYHKGTLT